MEKARIKLNQNLFVENKSTNSVKLIDKDGETFLNIFLSIKTFDIKIETEDEAMNDFVENNYRDKPLIGDSERIGEILGEMGQKNGIIEFTKMDPSKNERSTKLTVILDTDPKVPHSHGN